MQTSQKLKPVQKPIVLAIVQQKGGVGKSTTVKDLGIYFATRRKVMTLLMDFDPQSNLSNRMLGMRKRPGVNGFLPPIHPEFNPEDDSWSGTSSTVCLFTDDPVEPYPVPGVDLLHVLPAEGEQLSQVEHNTPSVLAERIIDQTRKFVQSPDVQERYPLIIIDTPPSRLALTRTALRAATHILIPMQMEKNNIDGLSDMLEMWREEMIYRPSNDPIEMIGILPNQYKNTSLHKSQLKLLKTDPSIGPFMLPFKRDARVSIADKDMEMHGSVLQLEASNKARKECEVMCKFIENKLFGNVSR